MDKPSIGAISTFISRLKNIKPKEGHTLFYRGHSDASYEAIPAIYRHIDNDKSKDKFVTKEDYLFRSMIAQCPSEFANCASTFDHLVKMQHYGLPTRLLDITSNPLVALYFACCSKYGSGGTSGEVLVYEVPDAETKFYSSDTVSVVSNIAKVSITFDFKKEGTKFLHEIKAEKPHFLDEVKEEHLHSTFCVKPKLDNQRIIKQSGAFLLFGYGRNKNTPAQIPDKYLYKEENKPVALPIVLNGKTKILKELADLSISGATLFPEIDNVAKFLKGSLSNSEKKMPSLELMLGSE